MWPKFQPDYFGPYYVSAGTLQNFTLYGRANFKTVNVTFNLNGEIRSIPIGDRSPKAIIFAPDEYSKNIKINAAAMGWKNQVWGSLGKDVQYEIVVSKIENLALSGIKFKNGARYLNTQLSHDIGVYTVEKIELNKDLTIEAMIPNQNMKYFQTTRAALDNGEPIPALNSLHWQPADGGVVQLRSCVDSVFLVQVENRLSLSYQINVTSDSSVSIVDEFTLTTTNEVGDTATIELSKAVVKQFCNAGSALQRAFSVDNTDLNVKLLASPSILNIMLHADAGPFYLKETLQKISLSPVFKHIQNVEFDGDNAEVSIAFPAPHRQVSGTFVTLQIPSQEQVRKVVVPITVLSPTTLKVKYVDPRNSGPFGTYLFSPVTQVVCYSSIREIKKNNVFGAPETGSFIIGKDIIVKIKGADNVGGKTKSKSNRGCVQVTSTTSIGNSKVTVDKIPKCERTTGGCTYYCHGGSEQWDTVLLDPTKYETFTVNADTEVKFPTSEAVTTSFSGSDLTVGFSIHSCARNGVKIALADAKLGENGLPVLTPICDNSVGGTFACTWAHVDYVSVMVNQKEYLLENSIMAPFGAAEMVPVTAGILSKYNKIRIEASGYYNETHKPIIAPADLIIPPPDFDMPLATPGRTDEGVTRNDADTTYMGRYGMRLMKIYNKDVDLIINNVAFENAGISDNVDFNPFLVEQLDNAAVQASTAGETLNRVLLDPTIGEGADNAAAATTRAYSIYSKFCERRTPSVEALAGPLGKRNGGAIFFSGKSFVCTGCIFKNNRVTGNGGAIFIESPQPGRVVIDPDMDIYSEDANYPDRIDLQAAGAPIKTTFDCNGCLFENNLAMSIARGPINTFDTLTGGFGGALSAGAGIRYKRVLERSDANKVVSVRRAYGSHGSLELKFNSSVFQRNFAWKSGGAINILGGRTVAKNSILKMSMIDSSFTDNKVSQGNGGAINLIKAPIMGIICVGRKHAIRGISKLQSNRRSLVIIMLGKHWNLATWMEIRKLKMT
jgi:hypothetical protein